MSRASKITLALSIVLTSLTVYGVHVQQKLEREAMYMGVLRDEERHQQRLRNMAELKQQQALQAELEAEQPTQSAQARAEADGSALKSTLSANKN